jgi:hypothetical protein
MSTRPMQEEGSASSSGQREEAEGAIAAIGWLAFGGLVVSALYCAQATGFLAFLSTAGVALTIAIASLAVGGLLGFLFGIPRALQHDRPVNSEATPENANKTSGYQANTNLEQISDWLTKILVGVGLTQLTTLPKALGSYADYAAKGFAGFVGVQAFAIAQLVFYVIAGFLVSYLWTRLHLAGAFNEADQDALGGKLREMQGRVAGIESQLQNDGAALSLLTSQLDPNQPIIPQERLDEAFKSASPGAKDQAFTQAQAVIFEYCNQRGTPAGISRAASVLRALIASDQDEVHFEYHGDLGIALLLKSPPEPGNAEAELTMAIDARGPADLRGYAQYEAYRASARIRQVPKWKKTPTEPELASVVRDDIEVALKDPYVRENLTTYHTEVVEWAQLNGMADKIAALATGAWLAPPVDPGVPPAPPPGDAEGPPDSSDASG